MSASTTTRHVRLPYLKGHCRKCREPVPKGRRSWCSQACVDAHLATTPAGFRAAIFRRDQGVCAECGRDCVRLKGRLEKRLAHRWRSATDPDGESSRRWARLLVRFGVLSSWTSELRSLWEADHIKPVVEGGGCTGPENGRTLCVPCHKRATADLARRRAEARSRQASLPLIGGSR